ILHGAGLCQSQIKPYYDAIGTRAFPTVLIIDPTGKIRYRSAGICGGQTTINLVAGFAGVSAPILGPPPPPPPPVPQAPIYARAMTGATIEVKYGAATWTQTLSLIESSEDLRL